MRRHYSRHYKGFTFSVDLLNWAIPLAFSYHPIAWMVQVGPFSVVRLSVQVPDGVEE